MTLSGVAMVRMLSMPVPAMMSFREMQGTTQSVEETAMIRSMGLAVMIPCSVGMAPTGSLGPVTMIRSLAERETLTYCGEGPASMCSMVGLATMMSA